MTPASQPHSWHSMSAQKGCCIHPSLHIVQRQVECGISLFSKEHDSQELSGQNPSKREQKAPAALIDFAERFLVSNSESISLSVLELKIFLVLFFFIYLLLQIIKNIGESVAGGSHRLQQKYHSYHGDSTLESPSPEEDPPKSQPKASSMPWENLSVEDRRSSTFLLLRAFSSFLAIVTSYRKMALITPCGVTILMT